MLKLKFNQDLIPVNFNKETAGKDMLWQKTYGAYLCKLKKSNYGEEFTCLEAENLASLVVPISTTEDVETIQHQRQIRQLRKPRHNRKQLRHRTLTYLPTTLSVLA